MKLDFQVTKFPLQGAALARWLKAARSEDVGRGDITTGILVGKNVRGRAVIIARESGVVCGIPLVEGFFRLADKRLKTKRLCKDGDAVRRGDRIVEIAGPLRAIFTAERVALNALQHLSGIATLTARYVAALRQAGNSRTQICDTRKTHSHWRMLEKYAVSMGGGTNHRHRLDDMILVKNNHVDAAGGIGPAMLLLRRRLSARRRRLPVGIEARNLQEVRAALALKPDLILLDNMSPAALRESIRTIAGRCVVEVSGGIGLRAIRALAGVAVDRLSVGALTHSAPALDFCLRYLDR
ncbi:MAG: carboxylating nicotinate-nucleotide diphosphorylase [bacterium]